MVIIQFTMLAADFDYDWQFYLVIIQVPPLSYGR